MDQVSQNRIWTEHVQKENKIIKLGETFSIRNPESSECSKPPIQIANVLRVQAGLAPRIYVSHVYVCASKQVCVYACVHLRVCVPMQHVYVRVCVRACKHVHEQADTILCQSPESQNYLRQGTTLGMGIARIQRQCECIITHNILPVRMQL